MQASNEDLRAETENPFGKFATQFLLPGFFGGAGVGTFISLTGALAENLGYRTPSPDTGINIATNLIALATTGFLWKRELDAQAARVKRLEAEKALAEMRVQILDGKSARGWDVGALTSGRWDLQKESGNADPRRVIVMCAQEAALQESLAQASKVSDDLINDDFVVVPFLAMSKTKFEAPPASVYAGDASESRKVAHLGLPFNPTASSYFLEGELEKALSQDPDSLSRGFHLVLKKNGRVGTRRLGLPAWSSLLKDVENRRAAGLDTKNI
jgi:hypothetical protein